MGRIRQLIEVKDHPCWTMFDSGPRNSYITNVAAEGLVTEPVQMPRQFSLGGKQHQITKVCIVHASVEGNPVEFQANVVDEIGNDEDGREIDLLFGALAMQNWGIKLDVPHEKLDLTHFAHDFVEFTEITY